MARLTRFGEWMVAHIERTRIGRAAWRLVENLDQHHAILAASAMAFDAFLSLIPLAAIAGWLLFRVEHLRQGGDLVLGPLLRAAPPPVGELVGSEFLRLSDSGAAAIPPLSIFVFLWVTSSGLSTAMSVFEAIFGSPLRAWYRRRFIAVGYVCGALAVVTLVGMATVLLATAIDSPIGRVVALLFPTGVLVALVCGFFAIAVDRRRARRSGPLLPGALVTVGLWIVVSALFSLYVVRLSRYATLYGNLATVAIFLFWLWLLSLAILLGGEVNAEIGHGRGPLTGPPPPPVRSLSKRRT